MKAILQFELPEEKAEFDLARNGHKYSIVIGMIDQKLRELSKYKNKKLIKIDDVRSLISELLNEYEVEL